MGSLLPYLIWIGLTVSIGIIWTSPRAQAVEVATLASPLVLDTEFLMQEIWNDGKAELAFYRTTRIVTRNGQEYILRRGAVSVLVKHDFDATLFSKPELARMKGKTWMSPLS